MRLGKHIETKTDNWSKSSKKKLSKAVEHKMKRIYVGILDALDKECSSGNMPKETANRLRAKVLNIGNDQIRNVNLELDKYNVEFIAYHYEFKNPPELEEAREVKQGEVDGR
jgi:hypothetical protein